MHELGLVKSILEIAEAYARREGARAIREIGLRVGALSGVEKEALEFAFEAAKQGTLAQQARLAVQWVPLLAFCDGCKKEFEVASPFGIALCPGCHQPTATLEQGLELEVDYLEVE
ncbi:hydrogenase maturation nickel metallochaperone HypA [Meiothermus cerbereus]|uniref:hydrogenase maturation nickel metallochaperone HypA n=1 Tax=Meiothermus cerbereus TaxID=65552 RepID=UPI003EED7E17